MAAALGCMYGNARLLVAHDLRFVSQWKSLQTLSGQIEKRLQNQRALLFHDFETWAADPSTTDNIFLVFEDQTYTYGQFFDRIKSVAKWLALVHGVQRQDVVALLGPSSPEFLLIWFALEALDAVVAFVGGEEADDLEIHRFQICGAKLLLSSVDFKAQIEAFNFGPRFSDSTLVYYSSDLINDITQHMTFDGHHLIGENLDVKSSDAACLLFTTDSGSPQSIVSRSRGMQLFAAHRMASYLSLQPGQSRIYTCLPLSWQSTQTICIWSTVAAGSTIVLSPRFMADRFWTEVQRGDANLIHYTGGLCRTLLLQPQSTFDTQHHVAAAVGSGLRKDLWQQFRDRFNLPTIIETCMEMNDTLLTIDKNQGPFGAGAIAKRGFLWYWFFGRSHKVVKIDNETGLVLRHPDSGFAVEAGWGEVGLLVHCVATEPEMASTIRNIRKHSDPRWLESLFTDGDLWLVSDNYIKLDIDGTVRFVDAQSDAFIWNMSIIFPSEISNVLNSFDQVADSFVMGVEIPHHEGHGGLATLLLRTGIRKNEFDWPRLMQHLMLYLPRRSIPVFVNIIQSEDHIRANDENGTNFGRIRKTLTEVVEDAQMLGNLYWLPRWRDDYIRFHMQAWNNLHAGNAKL